MFERFDLFEEKGLREDKNDENNENVIREKMKSLNSQFESKVKPVLYKGRYIYCSQEAYQMLLNGEIKDEEIF